MSMTYMKPHEGMSRRGSTMVVVALLMAGVAMLSLSFLSVLRSSHLENQGSRESLSALYACEAGLSLALDDLKRGGDGDIGTQYQPLASGSQEYWVEATDIGEGRTSLVSRGSDDNANMGVEMVVQPDVTGVFRWAAFGDEQMHMESNARTDSYDSGAGDYDSQAVNGSGSGAYADTDGDIGSNANITMDSNIGVWGDASPGPSGSVSGNLGNISGSTIPMASTVTLPGIVMPASPSTTDLVVNVATYTLGSGTHTLDLVRINTGRTLHVVGPATIVCTDFVLKSNSRVTVDASAGKVEFFVVNDFVLNSDTNIASTDNEPADVAFHLLSDNVLDPGIDVDFDEDLIDIDSGSKMFATIYAPDAAITIDSNFELFGSLVARRVDLDSNCRIHFDEALATLADESELTYQTLCWRIVAQP